MPRITFVNADGTEQEVEASTGESVMAAATSNLVPGIVGDCGGGMSCSTCHVYVDEKWIETVGRRADVEDEMLETTSEESTENSRLGCQIIVNASLNGLVVRVPESQW